MRPVAALRARPGTVRLTLLAVLAAGAALSALQAGWRGPDAVLAGAHSDHMMASAPPRASAVTVSEEKLAHVPGKSVTVQIVDLPPGAFVPEHHHAGSVTVYVLSGTIRSQLGGGPAMVYRTGETFFEPPGTVHVFAENVSPTEPAKLMAIHVADDGAPLTVYH